MAGLQVASYRGGRSGGVVKRVLEPRLGRGEGSALGTSGAWCGAASNLGQPSPVKGY